MVKMEAKVNKDEVMNEIMMVKNEVKLRSKLGFRCVYKSLLTACLVRIWFSSLLNSCFRLGNSGGMVSTMEGYLKQTRVIHISSSQSISNSVG